MLARLKAEMKEVESQLKAPDDGFQPTRRTLAAYDEPFTPMMKRNVRAARSAPTHASSLPATRATGPTRRSTQPKHHPQRKQQDPKMQALLDFSHLSQHELLKIAQHQRKKKKKKRKGGSSNVRRAAKASADRQAGSGRLEPRPYELKFEVSKGKIYAVPIASNTDSEAAGKKKQQQQQQQKVAKQQLQRHGQLPKLGANIGGSRRSPTGPSAGRRGPPRGRGFGGRRQQQIGKQRKPKPLSGRQRRLQRIAAATAIQKIVRGRAGRIIADEARERRKYLRSLTQKAQDYEERHGFDNWKFWTHEFTSSEEEEEEEEESSEGHSSEDEVTREERRLARRRLKLQRQMREEMENVLHWKPWH